MRLLRMDWPKLRDDDHEFNYDYVVVSPSIKAAGVSGQRWGEEYRFWTPRWWTSKEKFWKMAYRDLKGTPYEAECLSELLGQND